MIRRFNYTGRIPIKHADVPISLIKQTGNTFSFTAAPRLQDYTLPESALVNLDAYNPQDVRMHFHLGTVGNITIPEDTYLDELVDNDHIKFHLKVVDNTRRGLLFAEATAVTPSRPMEPQPPTKSLLPMGRGNLEQRAWEVMFGDAGPMLMFDEKFTDGQDLARSDPYFQAMIIPTVFSEILERILLVEDYHEDGEQDSWMGKWIQFAKRIGNVQEIPASDDEASDKKEWISSVVRAFCKKHKFLTMMLKERRAVEWLS